MFKVGRTLVCPAFMFKVWGFAGFHGSVVPFARLLGSRFSKVRPKKGGTPKPYKP